MGRLASRVSHSFLVSVCSRSRLLGVVVRRSFSAVFGRVSVQRRFSMQPDGTCAWAAVQKIARTLRDSTGLCAEGYMLLLGRSRRRSSLQVRARRCFGVMDPLHRSRILPVACYRNDTNEETLKTKEWLRTEKFLAEFKNIRTNRAVTGPPFLLYS